MLKPLFTLLCLSLFATVAFAAVDDADVVKLTADSFDQEVSEGPITLVEFFAPWCGHCKNLAPNYAKAATALKPGVKLASVDCTVEKDLCSRFGVQGFPTLKIFRGSVDSPSEYQGGRSEKDIINYMRKQSEPAFQVLTTAEEVEALATREGVEIVGLFASEDSEEAVAFKALAEELRNDYTFGLTTNAEAVAKYTSTVPALVLLKPEGSEETSVIATDSAVLSTKESQKQFIATEAFELVGEIGPETYQKYLDRGLPLVWSFLDYKAKDSKVLDALTEAAKEFKGRLSVVKLDGQRWKEHAKHFGLKNSLPGVVVEDRDTSKNYVFPEDAEFTADALKQHFEGFLAGTLQATLKTQAEPTDNDGPVTVLVGSSFERIVLDDEEKDVLVEFYAPWCGHCKSLAPKYDELGERYADDENVIIAKIDSTENDSPAKIQGFPTLIFYPAGDKSNPVEFEGDRSVEAMAEFIEEHRKSQPKKKGAAAVEQTETAATEEHKEEL